MTASTNQMHAMGKDQVSSVEPRRRILMVAHCFDADFSMESRLSWFRAIHAAKHYDTTVLCAEPFGEIRSDVDAKIPGLKVVAVPHTAFEKFLINSPVGFYLAYRLWHRRVLKTARKLHAKYSFALVHQVSYCGYREPGYCWQLGVPFIWGPVGGTQNVPWQFLNQFDAMGTIKEVWRTVANTIQLYLGIRVRRALRAASTTFVANRDIQASFRVARGIELPCQLETGIEEIAEQPRKSRELHQPLRVLWAGRLENWKALPLLLRAIAQLPSNFAIELRVVGSGSREHRMKRLAKQLGIEKRIDWVPLPDFGARDEHYKWADAFVFTSLRDTSGTGLLEALAAGVPIVGLNHQGARDIMSDECAIRVAVERPQQVIADLQAALVRLANDPQLLQRLSRGAFDRAEKYRWERLEEEMIESYADALGAASRSPSVQPCEHTITQPQTTTAAF